MKTIDYLTAQAQLAKVMRTACNSHKAVAINGLGKDEVVVVSKAEYQKLIDRQTAECAPTLNNRTARKHLERQHGLHSVKTEAS